MLSVFRRPVKQPDGVDARHKGGHDGSGLQFGFRKTIVDTGGLLLHMRLQPRERIVPSPRDLFEVAADVLDRPRFKLEPALAADAQAVHDAGLCQHAKMLCHGLA